MSCLTACTLLWPIFGISRSVKMLRNKFDLIFVRFTVCYSIEREADRMRGYQSARVSDRD